MDGLSTTYASNGRIREADLLAQLLPAVRRQALALRVRLPAGVDVDDLIQAGSIGAMEAIRDYRPEHGATLQTYAARRVHYAMLEELRGRDPLSRTTRAKARAAERAIVTLEQRLGRPPSEAETAAEMGLDLAAYRALLEAANAGLVLSLDDPEAAYAETIATDDPSASPSASLDAAALKAKLAAMIVDLPQREQQVLELYYVRDLNLKEIGRVLGVTESRVCQLHGQALTRMRAALRRGDAQAAAVAMAPE